MRRPKNSGFPAALAALLALLALPALIALQLGQLAAQLFRLAAQHLLLPALLEALLIAALLLGLLLLPAGQFFQLLQRLVKYASGFLHAPSVGADLLRRLAY